jgi:hypothetical protein
MDASISAWDRYPNAVMLERVTELDLTAFTSFPVWGKWGWTLAFNPSSTLETSGKAQLASEQSKRTSLWGLRGGPSARYFPIRDARGPVRWFVGGRIGLGVFSGTQTFTSTTSGSVSYRAFASELALTTGAEVALGGASLVIEGGFSRLHSSNFTSTGNSGPLYRDFPPGTRLAVANGNGSDDLRFSATGFFAGIGIQIPLGPAAEPSEDKTAAPAPDAPPMPLETSTPTPAATPAPAPTPEPTPIETAPAQETIGNPAPAPADIPPRASGAPTSDERAAESAAVSAAQLASPPAPAPATPLAPPSSAGPDPVP